MLNATYIAYTLINHIAHTSNIVVMSHRSLNMYNVCFFLANAANTESKSTCNFRGFAHLEWIELLSKQPLVRKPSVNIPFCQNDIIISLSMHVCVFYTSHPCHIYIHVRMQQVYIYIYIYIYWIAAHELWIESNKVTMGHKILIYGVAL